jgi:hypothetical protein
MYLFFRKFIYLFIMFTLYPTPLRAFLNFLVEKCHVPRMCLGFLPNSRPKVMDGFFFFVTVLNFEGVKCHVLNIGGQSANG